MKNEEKGAKNAHRSSGSRERTAEKKRDLRRALIEERNATDPALRAEFDEAICRSVIGMKEFRNATAILLYAPIGSEICVDAIRKAADEAGIPVGLPVCDPEKRMMRFRLARQGEPLCKGAFGIPEPPPSAPELIPDRGTVCVLPALAYDRERRRLGYGGGYYDRFLAGFPGLAVGVCYESNLLASVCAEPHDRAAHLIVTEKRTVGTTENKK